MLSLNPVYGDFVTGAKRGDAKFFYCRICKCDVKMGSHGAAEFVRHFWVKGTLGGGRDISCSYGASCLQQVDGADGVVSDSGS